jgi:hypothetical protein
VYVGGLLSLGAKRERYKLLLSLAVAQQASQETYMGSSFSSLERNPVGPRPDGVP